MRYSLWVVPTIIVSIAALYLLFFPLSFLFPGLVEVWLIDLYPTVAWTSGDKYVLANLLNILMIVIVAPVFEEFYVRGILLTRWTVKWGVIPAVIVSSVAFSLPHIINLIGMFCVGCVLAVFYIRTQSLFVPISIHFVHNLIASIIALLGTRFSIPTSPRTITEFQESWIIGLIALVISVPCVILFWRRYVSKTDWQVPYLSESPNSEDNTNSSTYE
ncbi:CPBP family intramembrane metalloprotease [Candidatus Poribacteria bacterium]|nr:CPBP family intramembrane metalloprotease [Candidatus Poribacteria bacterium]